MVADKAQITGRTVREIADSVEDAVESGRLAPSQALPSVRGLATRLGVSPSTVAGAYRDLRARGLVTSEAGRATRVGARRVSRADIVVPVDDSVRDLSDGNPDRALLPSLREIIADRDFPRHMYGAPAVLPGLAEIALAQFDDLPNAVGPAQVDVVNGAVDGVERVLAGSLRPNDRVIVEDPGYTEILDLVSAMGLVPVPVSVDDHGPIPESLDRAVQERPGAFVVTPRAQNPTGAALSAERAAEIRKILAAQPDLLVVEDDHASIIAGAPYVSVVQDRPAWSVVRSTSKYLGPDLRVGFLAADERTARRVADRRTAGAGGVSHLLQYMVSALWHDEKVRALVLDAARIYEERRRGLLDRLVARGITAHGRSGLNVRVPVQREMPVVQHLHSRGWAVRPGEAHRLNSPPFVRITTSTLVESECERLAADFAAIRDPSIVRHLA